MALSQAAQFFAHRLEPVRIRFVCTAVLALSLAVAVILIVTARPDHHTLFNKPLGEDFAGFYYAAEILNEASPDLLYDRKHQDVKYQELLSLPPDSTQTLPYVHPPFVAYMLRPLAMLPYRWAFAVWLVIAAALYLAGLFLLWKSCPHLAAGDRWTPLLLALAFEPFIMESWLGGQLSALGFFAFSLALYSEQRRHPVLCGMALGLALYKPTLLVVILPMLLIGRRFRNLLGFGLTALLLGGVSLLAVGWKGSLHYVEVLRGFSDSTGGALQLRDWKYVDLNTFLRLLLGSPSVCQRGLLLALLAGPLALVSWAWWHIDRRGDPFRRLVWAATLTATPVLNLYVGIYDSVLAAAGAVITADVLLASGKLPNAFRILLVLLFIVPWLTQPVARLTHVQAYTLVVLVMFAYQMTLALRRPQPSEGVVP